MSTLTIKIIEEPKGHIIDLETITPVGAQCLINECEDLLEKLKEKIRE